MKGLITLHLVNKRLFTIAVMLVALPVCSAVADEVAPYKDGFPAPTPYSGQSKGIKKMTFVENDEGLILRSEKSYAESHQHVAEYLRDHHMPALRKMGKLPVAEIVDIEKRGVGAMPSAEGLEIHENLIYATWGKRAMVLDLYVPQTITKKFPVVLVIHGGSWHRNSHRTYRQFAMKLAKRGYATACVEYRLTGEATFPAAIYDVKAATRWVRAHAAQYHLDPKRVGITGASAGGHIAALAAVTHGDKRFEGDANHLDYSSKLQCLVSMDGVIDRGVKGSWINDSKDALFHRETIPYYHVVNRATYLPPTLFIQGGEKTYEWIQEHRKDVPVDWFMPGLPHAYELVDGEQVTVIGWLDSFFIKHL